jgi:hypothetical protein
MALDDRDLRQVAEIVDQVVSRRMGSGNLGGRTAGSTGGTGGDGSVTPGVSAVMAGLSAVGQSLAMMTVGTYKATDAVGDMSKIIGAFGPVGQALGGFGKDIGAFAFGLNDSLKDVSKSGFTFGQDLGLFAKSVTAARMSVPEFQEFIRHSGEQIAGLGSSARDSGLRFLQMGKDMQEDDFAQRLKILGMGSEELNSALKLTAAARRNENMNDAAVRKSAVDAAIQMATEFDNIARLTGRSRQKQQEAMEKEQARLDRSLAIQGMDPAQKKALDEATNIAGMLGDQGIEVARILALGGPKNAEDQKAVVAMPEEQRNLIARLVQIQGNSPAANAERENIRIQMLLEAERSSSNRALNTNLSNLVQSQNDQLVQMGRTQMSINQTGNTISQMRNEYQEALQGGKEGKDPKFVGTFEDFLKANLKAVSDLRNPANDPSKLPGGEAAAAAQAINAANELLKTSNSAVAAKFSELNITIGKRIIDETNFANVIKKYTTEDIPNAVERVKNYVKEMVGESGGNRKGDGYKDQAGAKAEGGEVFSDRMYPIETPGFEMFSPSSAGNIINNNVLRTLASNVNSLQNDLKSTMSNRDSGNSAIMSDLKDMLSGLKLPADKVSISGSNFNPVASGSNASGPSNSEVADLLRTLNTNIVKLTDTVDNGSRQQVRAVKSQGNLLA